jgi:putative intracellular protease/amidase
MLFLTLENMMTKKILMVVTSNSALGSTGKTTGIWAEELAVPCFAFTDAGHEVEIASPKGGQAPFDPNSIKAEGQNHASVERMLADARLAAKAANTHILADVVKDGFDAIFFPGGHGTMWDMADNADIKVLVESADRNGLVIGAVCHGVSALVSATGKDGKPFVAGRRVNSFTDAEEEAAGLTSVMPFLLESRLRALGARFECAPNWQAFSVRDGHLITGQNPASSALVADHMLAALRAA